MALLTISGEPASRFEEVAQLTAHLLNFELVPELRLSNWIAEEFAGSNLPDHAWKSAAVSILARMAREHHLVIAAADSESLFPAQPGVLRVHITAPESRRAGNLMLDQRIERPQALHELARLDSDARQLRRARFARSTEGAFDIILNAEFLQPDQMAEILRAAANARCLSHQGLLSPAAEAELQFNARLELARHNIAPAARARLSPVAFSHPSEEMFANLLDFYRIQWAYEPRSFPLQWDRDGSVTEAFTPDFYLSEFDLYIELTTMKQALVTKKNRKIKLLKAIYPHINIQVFYQKDFQDLVQKYGLRIPPQ